MIVKHPVSQAPRMANDFTRINFGWWSIKAGQRPDIIEYGTALAAAFDCPGAFLSNLKLIENTPRADDLFEVIRRWEVARESGFITEDIKAELKKTEQEHTLLIDENKELELVRCEHLEGAAGGNTALTAFIFERGAKTCAVLWNNEGEGRLLCQVR